MENQRSKLREFLANDGITLEVILKAAEARFAPLFFPAYFRVADPSVSLEYETVLSSDTIEAMATVGSRESEYPLHGRRGLEKVRGEIPAVFVRRKLDANELRNIEMIISSNALGLPERLRAVMAREVDDLLYVRNSVLRRVDAMCKQAVSTGSVSVTPANNPNGVHFDVPLLPAANLLKSNADWSVDTTDIVRDLETVRQKALDTGTPIARVMVGEALWYRIIQNKSLQNFLKAYANPGSNARYAMVQEGINAALAASRLPVFDIVPDMGYVQEDGRRRAERAWAQDNAAFVPQGDLGVIHNALADEQITPAEGVDYLVSDGVLLSRWRERKPLAEITEGAWNAFPGLQQAAGMFVMDTKG